MKKTTRFFLSSIAFFALAPLAFSVETGGLLTNDTKFANIEKDGGLKLDQKNGINLWARHPLSEDGTSYFAAEGLFQTEYDASIEESDKKLLADVTLFKLVVQKELDSGSLVFSAGRFFNSDLSGVVYTQNGDGAKFDLNISRISVSLFGAYTGLLNAKTVTILTSADQDTYAPSNDSPDLSEKSKTVYVLADKYFAGGVTFALPHIFASQTIAAEGFGAFGLESKKYNRFYGTVALNGPLVPSFFYDVSSTFGFAKYDDGDMEKGNLTKGSITFYPDIKPTFESASISVNGLYASGQQGSFKSFQGFTSGTSVNSLDQPEYSNVLLAGLSATLKPVSNVLLSAKGDLVFDTAAGEDSDKIKQCGFQYSAGFNWQIVSDVSLGASFGQFIGQKVDDVDYSEAGTGIGGNKTELKITAAIAF